VIDNIYFGFRTSKSLQNFLQFQTRGYKLSTFGQGLLQRFNFRNVDDHITTQSQRPDCVINKQRHQRERWAL
jgi:hypothetical protein